MLIENKDKVGPSHDIYKLLSFVALAHLILGDGSQRDNGLMFFTDSFY